MAHASLHRQITDLVTWATARIADLDAQERFEESYALTQELREWILCIEEHPELLPALLAPRPDRGLEWQSRGPQPLETQRLDGLLEI